ncbi:MAG: endopeptidase La [Oscillospiraceae bacterium]|nr:endopeptidase La [Oscillospiraceae bacterium]
MSETNEKNIRTIPLLALRGLIIFPQMLLTFDVERAASLAAISAANKGDHLIFLSAQKDISVDVPLEKDIYAVGTVCRIRQQIRGGRAGCRLMVEGLYRARAISMDTDGKGYAAVIEPLEEKAERLSAARREAMMRNALALFHEYLQMNQNMMNEQLLNVLAHPDAAYVANYIAQHLRVSVDARQEILEECQLSKRLAAISRLLANELNILSIEQQLNEATQEAMERNQREYYLREELKVIQAELGEDAGADDFGEYRRRIEALAAPKAVQEKLKKELSRLQKQPFGSSEAAVLRAYIETVLELPWGVKTEETLDLKKARKILDEEHFGLEKVKERILEYLSVRQLTPELKGGLLCLVGPPGTGKTSIAMSIAHATNRKLVRLSLGGVHDEAEIRGHRKTYIGSMPGRIMNGVMQAKSCNPLMVLDEIDKLGADYRGDPSAALLEVLDAEQNGSFRDHFLEIPFDLSEVFFITTANTTDTIPRPLLDRMEIIELSSYTDEEKLEIAKRHLLPKQRKKHGLRANQLRVSDEVLREIICGYTRESGVRRLERELASLCRKTAARIAEGSCKSLNVRQEQLEALLGPVKYKRDEQRAQDEIGLVRGLAYTSVGGEVLDVEVAVVDGSGKLELTGNLGDVMKESAHAALTYIRSRAQTLGVDPEFYKKKDIHIHFPEGAVPKDGPSAGITVTVALVSALTGAPARRDVAMTGEITLRGRVLPIGGLKEKTMAALRAGMHTVILPADNLPDLAEIDPTVRAALHFVPTDHVDKILDIALVREYADCDDILFSRQGLSAYTTDTAGATCRA